MFVHNKAMRKYIRIEENDLEMVKCNKCGKELEVSRGTIKEGVFSIDYAWGYFSERMERYIHLICVKNVMIRC